MDETRSPEDEELPDDVLLTVRRLKGLQHGIAAVLMPASDAWRVQYFSQPTFDTEPGTDFPSLEEAITAITEVLPWVNSPEEKARATAELRAYLRSVSENQTRRGRSP